MAELQTKIEELNSVKKKIEVTVPVEKIKQVMEQEYEKVAKTAKIKGFRKGKVPRHILKQYYKDMVEKETMERLVRETYPEAVEKEMVIPISAPYVDPSEFAEDNSFTYTAIFEVRPVIVAKEYAGMKLEKPEVKVVKEEVEAQLEELRQRMSQLEPLDDKVKAENGTVLIIDFVGTAEGVKFEGSEAKDFMVELGAGNMLPEFEKVLTGTTKNDEVDIEIDYPADYFNKELAGKKGKFHIKVKDLKKKIIPELNDEFAKDLGDFKTLEAVKKDIEKRISEAKESESKSVLTNQIMDILVEKNPFEIPESMIHSELKVMFEGFVKQLSSQGKKIEDLGLNPEKFIEQYKGDAEKRVSSFLLIDAIAEVEKIAVDNEELEERIKLIAEQAGETVPKVKQYYESQNLINGLKIQLQHEKTIDFIIEKAKIKTIKPEKVKKTSKKDK